MAAEADQQVGTGGKHPIDIDPGDRTAGADGFLPADAESDGGKMPALAEAAGSEPDETGIPALLMHHEDMGAVRAGGFQLLHRRFRHSPLQILPLPVGGFQQAGDMIRLGRIRREEQVNGEFRIPQAADGIQPGRQAEGQVVRVKRRLGPGGPEQGLQARTGRGRQGFHPFADNDPVLPEERNDVRHGGDGREIKAFPDALEALHRLADLEGDAGPAQGWEGIGAEQRIHDYIRRGQDLRGLMVIRDDDSQAQGFGEGDFLNIGNAAVHSDQEGTLVRGLADGLLMEAVAFLMAGGDPVGQGSAFLMKEIQED